MRLPQSGFFWEIIAIKLRKKHRTTHTQKNTLLAADSVDVNKDIGGV